MNIGWHLTVEKIGLVLQEKETMFLLDHGVVIVFGVDNFLGHSNIDFLSLPVSAAWTRNSPPAFCRSESW